MNGHLSALERLTVTVHGAGSARDQLPVVRGVYGEGYPDSPFTKSTAQIQQFVRLWPRRLEQPGFRLVSAQVGGETVGVAFGHELVPGTPWWDGAVEPLPETVTEEYEGRTFAVTMVGVRAPYRRHGVARRLHTHLVAGSTVERLTLLVRPTNDAACRAYASWGYRRVGRIQPYHDSPVLDAMVKTLAADTHVLTRLARRTGHERFSQT